MKSLHLLAALLLTHVVSAQSTTSADSTRPKSVRVAYQLSKDFGVYIGLNNYAGAAPTDYDLRPIGSRYVALSWRRFAPLSGGRRGATWRIGFGPEIAWNNFMFENRRELIRQNNQLEFRDAGPGVRKSKLVVAQLNVPVLLNVVVPSGFSIGAGVYGGFRVGSYTAVKFDDGPTRRDHDRFGLLPFRWGLTAELGWQDQANLFVRYEPSPLFRAGRGPELNTWAVGLRL